MITDNEFDSLLHDALTEYRDSEPLAGLGHRVLQRLSAQTVARRQNWLRWSLAAACALVLLVAASLILQSRREPAQRELASQPVPAPSTAEKSPAVKTTAKLENKPTLAIAPRRAPAIPPATAAALPAQQFPLPVKTTTQEQALAALATAHPDALAAGSQGPQLIAISPLVITPLASVNQPVGED